MCEYCDKTFTGDINKEMVELEIDVNGYRMFGVHTCIEDSDENAVINTYLTDQFGRCFTNRAVKIRYCPVCGRKFDNEGTA